MVSPISNQGPQYVSQPSSTPQTTPSVASNSANDQALTVSNQKKRFGSLRRANMAQMSIQHVELTQATSLSALITQAAKEVKRASANLTKAKQASQATHFAVYSKVIVPQATTAYNLALDAQKLVKAAKTAKQITAAKAALTKAKAASTKTESQLALPPAATTALNQASLELTNDVYFQTSSPEDQLVYNQVLTAKNAINTARTKINTATTASLLEAGRTALTQAQALLTTAQQAVTTQVTADKADLLNSAQSSVPQAQQALTDAFYFSVSPTHQDNVVYNDLLAASNALNAAITLVNGVTNPATLGTAKIAVTNAQVALAAAIQAIQDQFDLDKTAIRDSATQHLTDAQNELDNDTFFQLNHYDGDFAVYDLVQQAFLQANTALVVTNDIPDFTALDNAQQTLNNSIDALANAKSIVATQLSADKTALTNVATQALFQSLQTQNLLDTYFQTSTIPEDQVILIETAAAISRVQAAHQQVLAVLTPVTLGAAYDEVWLAKSDLLIAINGTNKMVDQGIADSTALQTLIQLVLDNSSDPTGNAQNAKDAVLVAASNLQAFKTAADGSDVLNFTDIFFTNFGYLQTGFSYLSAARSLYQLI